MITDLTANTVSPKNFVIFIHSMFVGYHLLDDLEKMVDEVKNTLLWNCPKGIISALKDARNKYSMNIKSE